MQEKRSYHQEDRIRGDLKQIRVYQQFRKKPNQMNTGICLSFLQDFE